MKPHPQTKKLLLKNLLKWKDEPWMRQTVTQTGSLRMLARFGPKTPKGPGRTRPFMVLKTEHLRMPLLINVYHSNMISGVWWVTYRWAPVAQTVPNTCCLMAYCLLMCKMWSRQAVCCAWPSGPTNTNIPRYPGLGMTTARAMQASASLVCLTHLYLLMYPLISLLRLTHFYLRVCVCACMCLCTMCMQ